MLDSTVANELRLQPLTEALGTQVSGIDLRQPIAPAVADRLVAAYRQTDLLLFRDQDISAADQSRVAALFGRILIRPSPYEGVAPPEFADQQHVSNARPDGILGDGELTLHADHFWHEDPIDTLMLYGIEVPAAGGETRFCASGAALAAMPAALRARLAGLRCVHMFDFGRSGLVAPYDLSRRGEPNLAEATHPLVWTDPVSGRQAIWLDAIRTAAVEGLPAAEVPALFAELHAWLDQPRFNYLHAWRAGDLLVWDNRLLLHARTPFDRTARRTLRRTPIKANG